MHRVLNPKMKILLILVLGVLNGGRQCPWVFSAEIGPASAPMAIASAEQDFLMDSDLISSSNSARGVRQTGDGGPNPFLKLPATSRHLSTNQLNSFTKAAVDLVQANCDGLDDTKMTQLNSFLTNVVLVDSNLVSGQFDNNDHDHDELSFSELLQSMKSCSTKVVINEQTKVMDESVKKLTKISNVRQNLRVKVDDNKPVKGRMVENEKQRRKVTKNPTQRKKLEEDQKQKMEKVKQDKKQTEKIIKHDEKQKEKIKENQKQAHIHKANNDKQNEQTKEVKTNEKELGQKKSSKIEDEPLKKFHSRILNWFHTAYTRVSKFFKNLFHPSSKPKSETTTTLLASHPRSRRSELVGGDDMVVQTSANAGAPLQLAMPLPAVQKSQKTMGKRVVKQILLAIFRIYGHSCPGVSPSNFETFKIAAKTLLKLITKTNQLTAFAGDNNNNLDKKLLQTLHQCQRKTL